MIRQTETRDCKDPGSARVSRAGFGVPPKRTSITSRFPFRFQRQRKVRDGEAPSPAREGARAPQP